MYTEEINDFDYDSMKKVGIDDYDCFIFNKSNQTIYTVDVKTCIVMCVICDDKTYLIHLSNINELNRWKGIIRQEDINKIVVFYGTSPDLNLMNCVKNEFGIQIYPCFINQIANSGTIGYNPLNDEFYGVRESDMLCDNIKVYKYSFEKICGIEWSEKKDENKI